MKEETKNWLEESQDDLRIVLKSLKEEEYKVSVFYSQQAIEKSLKALIIEKKDELVKSHSLELLGKIAKLDEETIKNLEEINPTYTESRYIYKNKELPSKKYDFFNASKFFKIAKDTILTINKKINDENFKLIKEKEEIYNSTPDEATIKKLKIIKKKIKKIIKLEHIYLFGSRAKGNYTKNSDIDILIISEDFKNKKTFERPSKFYNIFNFNLDKDIICLTKEELEKEKNKITFIADAMEYAIEIK